MGSQKVKMFFLYIQDSLVFVDLSLFNLHAIMAARNRNMCSHQNI